MYIHIHIYNYCRLHFIQHISIITEGKLQAISNALIVNKHFKSEKNLNVLCFCTLFFCKWKIANICDWADIALL